MGRAGRGGEPSICVFLHLKSQRLPKEMRPFFKADSAHCQRRALTEIFTLHDTDGGIVFLQKILISCPTQLSTLLKSLWWSAARLVWTRAAVLAASASILLSGLQLAVIVFSFSCCTNCTATCISCPLGTKLDADQLVKEILGLGGAEYE